MRLTADGQSQTQPIISQDGPAREDHPRSAADLHPHHQIEDRARAAAASYKEARDLLAKLQERPQSAANDALVKQVEAIAPVMVEPQGGRGGRGGRGGFGAEEPATPPNLSNIGAELVAAVQPMQASEMPPTAVELEAVHHAEAAYATVMAKWTALKAKTGAPPAATGAGAGAAKNRQ